MCGPKGQTIRLPAGNYNRVYILAASADGDQKAAFKIDNVTINLNIQNWGGFVGQWDDRTWTSKDTSHDDYGEMTGINPGYIKRADVAWYCSHHHNSSGANVSYSYSYLFAYPIDIPIGARTLTLPGNDKIRIVAISLAEETPSVKPVLPLYDLLSSSPVSH
jgi:alpha-mannosidase